MPTTRGAADESAAGAAVGGGGGSASSASSWIGANAPVTHCSAVGAGLESCVVRQLSSFTIRAATEDGEPQTTGGDDSFFVSIRGPGARVRARVADNADGTYEVLYKTEMSGTYAIFVSLLGEGEAA